MPYETEFQKELKLFLNNPTNWFEIERKLTIMHANAVNEIKKLSETRLNGERIQIIGFHGQTVLHNPSKHFTWQIGDPNLLGRLTGIDVVGDFRRRDVSYGGQGAPLVPIFHKALMSKQEKPLIVLNIGGVANLTYIGENEELVAFDTGPGNALIDDLMNKLFNQRFDDEGKCASEGKIDYKLIKEILSSDEFFSLSPPKSLDRNRFHYVLDKTSSLNAKDRIATVSYLTVASIEHSIRVNLKLDELKLIFVCGGGAKNLFIMSHLSKLFAKTQISNINRIGYETDFIESQAFAYLAVRQMKKLPSSFPTTTGASQEITAGSFFPFK